MKTRYLWIQIESSHAFSVGAKDDSLSVPVIWASGEAGWFEIVPSEPYRPICDTMFHAVCLHYSLLDQYEGALQQLQKSKKKKKATFADVTIEIYELLLQVRCAAAPLMTYLGVHQR
jgi:predicted membrane GTPase involved in stress response